MIVRQFSGTAVRIERHAEVMGNMFNTPFEIHKRYDLKGWKNVRSHMLSVGDVNLLDQGET